MLQNLDMKTIEEIIKLSAIRNKAGGSARILNIPSSEADERFNRLLRDGFPEYVALLNKIEALSKSALAELIALMWLGKDAGLLDQTECLLEKAESKVEGEYAASYIAGKKTLEKYLNKGLNLLGCI